MKRSNFAALGVLVLLSFALVGCGGGGPEPELVLGGIDAGAMLQGLLDRTDRSLAQVNSIDGAKKAEAELRRINEDYDDLLFHLQKLSDKGRTKLARDARRALPQMRATVAQIHEMPALDDVLGATLNQMLAKLELVQ